MTVEGTLRFCARIRAENFLFSAMTLALNPVLSGLGVGLIGGILSTYVLMPFRKRPDRDLPTWAANHSTQLTTVTIGGGRAMFVFATLMDAAFAVARSAGGLKFPDDLWDDLLDQNSVGGTSFDIYYWDYILNIVVYKDLDEYDEPRDLYVCTTSNPDGKYRVKHLLMDAMIVGIIVAAIAAGIKNFGKIKQLVQSVVGKGMSFYKGKKNKAIMRASADAAKDAYEGTLDTTREVMIVKGNIQTSMLTSAAAQTLAMSMLQDPSKRTTSNINALYGYYSTMLENEEEPLE